MDGQTVTFVVEDKTDTEVHGEQLARHLEEDLIKPIYCKTGYIFGNEREAVEQEGFSVFVQDMADFLDGQSATQENEMLRQYAEYLAVYLEPRSPRCAVEISDKHTCSGSSWWSSAIR